MYFIFQGSYFIQGFLLYPRLLTVSRFLYIVILHAVELCLVCLLSSIWTYVLLPVKWLLHHSTHQPLFFNKDYTKSCAFVSFHWSAPEGILIQSVVGGAQPAQSVILTRTWAQCTNRTPMNNCCRPLR